MRVFHRNLRRTPVREVRRRNEARVVASRPTDFSGGMAPYALDPGNAARLWTLAEQLTAE